MKYGLVLEGGSRRCEFTAGILDYFMDKKVSFPYVCGVSAGAHAAINYVSKQDRRLKYILCPSKLRKGKKAHLFLDGPQREFKILNYDSFYGNLPFDFNTFFSSDIECEVAMTCAETGKIEFKTEKKDETRLQDIMNASSALPIIFPIASLDGNHYVDGCITDAIPFDRAFEKGCEKVIIISTKVTIGKCTNFSKHKYLLSKYQKFPKLYEAIMRRHLVYQEQSEKMQQLIHEGKILLLSPEKAPCSPFETKVKKLYTTYDQGFHFAQKNFDKIMAFMKD